MSYRIIIEDQNGLHQAILNETKEAKEVVHNINNILKMSDLTDYIYMFDLKKKMQMVVIYQYMATVKRLHRCMIYLHIL